VAHHLIQRGNNKRACFYMDQDYELFLKWLQEYSTAADCHVHAYVLMSNHVHLLVTPMAANGVGYLMKRLGQRYVQYINREYRRSGSLWEGRFRSCLVQGALYALTCYRYVELNPVRASMVRHPAEYRWSSYRVNAQGEASPLIAPHDTYLSLARTSPKRAIAYRELFDETLDADLVDEFRTATNGNYAIGCDRFKRDIELALHRRATPGRSGRPRLASKEDKKQR
jgi:putative transposase